MDPLSIAASSLAIAASLYNVAESLYSFVKATGTIDRSVSSLQSQVNGLANVLKSLSTALRHPSLERCARDNSHLWQHVGESVNASSATTDELNTILQRVAKPGSNQLKQAWRQLKLGFAQDDVARLLAATRTHSVNLQLSIGIINVLLCASSPSTIINDQAIRFERLEKMIDAINLRLQPAASAQDLPGRGNMNIVLDENTIRLTQAAETVMSSRSTIAGYSARTGTECTLKQDLWSAFNYIDIADSPDDAEDNINSTTGSEHGISLDSVQRAYISEWIPAMSQIDEDSGSPSRNPHGYGLDISENKMSTEIQPTKLFAESFDDSSDDDVDFQVAKNLFSKASQEFQLNQYLSAENLLKSSLDHSTRLSHRQQEALSLKEMHLKYAICKSRTGKMNESEEILLQIAREPVGTPNEAKMVFEAIHNLALIQLRRRNFEAAEIHCRQALRGRGRTETIGKNHPDYLASLKLYSIVVWAQGDKIRGQAYLDLLPEEKKLSKDRLDEIILNPDLFYDDAAEPKSVAEGTKSSTKETSLKEWKFFTRQDIQNDQSATSPSEPSSKQTKPMQPMVGSRASRVKDSDRLSSTGEAKIERRLISPTALRLWTTESAHHKQNPLPPRKADKLPIVLSKPIEISSREAVEYVLPSERHRAYSSNRETPAPIQSSEPAQQQAKVVSTAAHKPRYDSYGLSAKMYEVLNNRPTRDLRSLERHNRFMRRTSLQTSESEARIEELLDLSSTNAHLNAAVAMVFEKGFTNTSNANKGLIWAAMRDARHAVNAILVKFPKVDINLGFGFFSYFPLGWSPLHAAAQQGHMEICAKLLLCGANLERLDNRGNTPLDLAIVSGKTTICRLFLQQGARCDEIYPYRTALMKALHSRCSTDYNLCKLLLERGANANADDSETAIGGGGRTALMIATSKGRGDIVRLLLEYGADVNREDQFGDRVLSHCNTLDICLCLIDHGANPFEEENFGFRTLDVFWTPEQVKVIKDRWQTYQEGRV